MADLAFDLDTLTLEEVETLEEVAGASVDALDAPGAPKARMMMAIAVVVQRRTNPEFGIDDARKMTVKQVEQLLSPAEAPVPSEAVS